MHQKINSKSSSVLSVKIAKENLAPAHENGFSGHCCANILLSLALKLPYKWTRRCNQVVWQITRKKTLLYLPCIWNRTSVCDKHENSHLLRNVLWCMNKKLSDCHSKEPQVMEKFFKWTQCKNDHDTKDKRRTWLKPYVCNQCGSDSAKQSHERIFGNEKPRGYYSRDRVDLFTEESN